jgi:phage terminase large subunit-like protein
MLASLSLPEKQELVALLEEKERRKRRRKLFDVYPETGPLRRGLYPKHLQFFAAGREHQERAAVAANRVGKSFGLGGFETALHLTGLYPDWWPGRRFAEPIDCWAAGDTSETTRDIPQLILMGAPGEYGTGLIPGDRIVGNPTHRSGVAQAVDTVRVAHASGGVSYLGFKSYDQGRKKFQGTAKHLIWLDEEPPEDVYSECMARLMTTNGMMICTFTPLEGLSNVVLRYMPDMAPTVTANDPLLRPDRLG